MKKYTDCIHDHGGNCAACPMAKGGIDCHGAQLADASKLISTTAYAQQHGKDPATVRQLLGRGGFSTATRIGRNWFISQDEPYPDRRVTSGAFRGWRK